MAVDASWNTSSQTKPISFAGMVPRASIEQVQLNSSAKDKLFPGDVILSIVYPNGDTRDTFVLRPR